MRRKIIAFMFFFIILAIGLLVAHGSAGFNKLESEGAIVLNAASFSPSLEAYNLSSDMQSKFEYQTAIEREAFGDTLSDAYGIVLYRLADNAHRIYFNDVLIGEGGDFQEGNSNLWNSLFTYSLSSNLIQEHNVLRIETKALYRTGLSVTPIYIAEASLVQRVTGTSQALGEQINLVMIGFILASSVITFLFYLITMERDPIYLFATLGAVSIAVYYTSYLTYDALVFTYFTYKRIAMMGLFLSISSYGYVVSEYLNVRYIRVLAQVTFIVCLLATLLSKDMIQYKIFYSKLYFLVLLNVLCWVIASLNRFKSQAGALLFLGSFVIMGLFGLVTVVMDSLGLYFTMNSPFVYLSVLAIVPFLIIYETMIGKELLIVEEKTLRQKEGERALTDGLTGVWNRRYLSELFEATIRNDTMAILDIDHFKMINDTYGHLAGDFILRNVVEIMKKHIRKTDDICRYGGDEFVLIMYDCPLNHGYRILEDMRLEISRHTLEYEHLKIKVTVSIGAANAGGENTVKQLFHDIDGLLYEAKTAGRNQTAILKTEPEQL